MLATQKKRSKHFAKSSRIDGIYLPSLREAKRYVYLKALQSMGDISNLEVHKRVPIIVEIDFAYVNRDGKTIWEDVKGKREGDEPAIKLWKLKHKLVKAVHGIEVRLV